MKQTKQQRAQCVSQCEPMAGTKQQCEYGVTFSSARLSSYK